MPVKERELCEPKVPIQDSCGRCGGVFGYSLPTEGPDKGRCNKCIVAVEIEEETADLGRPVGYRVLVRKFAADERTAGGILLPDAAQEQKKEGVVLKLGEGIYLPNGVLHPIDEVAIGETVTWVYGGTEIKVGDEPYTVVGVQDILYAESG